MSWQIDTAHSEVQFTVRHMMFSKVRGHFETFSGTVDYDPDNPTASKVNVTIDVNSIYTREEKRDAHLKSPDFFDTATYPTLTFVSTSVEQTSDDTGLLHGNLTIKGVTKPVTLEVEHLGTALNPWGAYTAGFTASTKINRKDWGLNWNQALEAGGVLVGDDITINIEVELMKQPEAAAEAAAA